MSPDKTEVGILLASKPPRDSLVGLTEPMIDARGGIPLVLSHALDGRPIMPKKTQISAQYSARDELKGQLFHEAHV